MKKLIELKSSAMMNTYLGRHILEDASLKIWQREVTEMRKRATREPISFMTTKDKDFSLLSTPRKKGVDAMRCAFSELATTYPEDMVAICAGGVIFGLTGEDGAPYSDDDIQSWIKEPATLENALFVDLWQCWQGFPSDEEREAAKTISATVAKRFIEAVS